MKSPLGTGAAAYRAVAPAADRGSGIAFDGVSVAYGGVTVLEALTLTVNPGEIVALIGPSGSGKTTALRAVAGFVQPATGRIRIGTRDVTDVPPHDRNIGMVVQNYALFPHMRVDENVAFGLRARKAASALVAARVPEALAMVGMAAYARRFPRELSGGQQQRVAIARALAIKPQVLLLDEPLSALDAQIRRSMLDELARLHRELPDLTVLYVTHDQIEALTLADRIGIMRDGKLVAFGPAQALYRHPPNRFAAEFLGRANLLPVTGLEPAADGMARVRFGDVALTARNHHALPAGDECLLCVRPHDVHVEPHADTDNTLVAVVRSIQWQGDTQSVELALGEHVLRLACPPRLTLPGIGDPLPLHFRGTQATLVPVGAALG
ncbi:MAG: ABC transporter ATP-binding protein [Proteobacteria bacterium]|nr:ABC transporter ATP-binding protein [Pseudomonadota bacterium]